MITPVNAKRHSNRTLTSINPSSPAEDGILKIAVAGEIEHNLPVRPSLAQVLTAIFRLDLRSLATFRIAFGVVILVDLLIRAQDLRFFYTDEGVLPRSVFSTLSGPWDISLYLANGSWQFAAFLLSITVGVCTAFICGFRTKEATILLWLLILSLHFRNGLILQGGDGVVRCLLFWSMFLPLGQKWSIDARINPPVRGEPPALQNCSVATMCVVFQAAMIYFFSALMKTHDIWRVQGTALQYALNIDQFTNANGHFLLQYPELLRWLTFWVLGMEQFACLLLFIPWRYQLWRMVVVAIFSSFHLGIAITMELGLFPYVCLSMWLLFLPPIFWDYLQKRFFTRTQLLKSPSDFRRATDSQRSVTSGGIMATVQSVILGFFILNVMQWNIRNLDLANTESKYPAKYDFILGLVGLTQNWGMFSPYPLNWDGWFLISGKTKSGRVVNLSPGAEEEDEISAERPKKIWAMYGNERQRKYMMSLASYSSLPWRPYYVRAVALDWARRHPEDELGELDIVFFYEITLPDGSSTAIERSPIWHSNAPSSGL